MIFEELFNKVAILVAGSIVLLYVLPLLIIIAWGIGILVFQKIFDFNPKFSGSKFLAVIQYILHSIAAFILGVSLIYIFSWILKSIGFFNSNTMD